MRGSYMRGSFRIPCPDCGEEGVFVVEAVSADELDVTRALHGCNCLNRPSVEEALAVAAEDFTNRIEGARWAALGGRV